VRRDPTPPAAGLLDLPPELAARGVALRRERPEDLPFLERLYFSVRWQELAQLDWPEDAKLGFLRQQFSFQVKHYSTYYAGADFGILEHEGVPIGRLYLFRGERDLRIVDISLLPEWRGGGLGTLVLQAVLAEAGACGRTVSIHVEKFNPAQRLYRRLGFRTIGEDGPYWLMECG
jgi:ribosomal protein S18 acetylase RimI-like enzyme